MNGVEFSMKWYKTDWATTGTRLGDDGTKIVCEALKTNSTLISLYLPGKQECIIIAVTFLT